MLLRILQGVVLGLIVFVACDDKKADEDNKPSPAGSADEGKYQFSMVGDDGLLNDGKGKIELQLMKDDKAVSKLEKSVEVTLTIVCGAEQTAEIKEEIGTDGKASIDVDLSAKGWGTVDWQACKLSATAKVNGKDIKATDVDLKTIGGEGATVGCSDPNGCDDDGGDTTPELPQLKMGEEIGAASSLTGKLSLHGCSNAVLYTVDGNTVTRDADGVVEADATTGFKNMFLLGVAGDKCKLQHTAKGETTAKDWAAVVEAAAGDNKAAGHAVGIMVYTAENIKLTLPSANKPASAQVYVSGDGGAEATKKDIVWDDNEVTTDIDAKDDKSSNAMVLVKVSPAGDDNSTASEDKVWWHAYGESLSSVWVGSRSAVPVAQLDTARKLQVKIAEGGKCGLHFFYLKSAANDDYIPRRIYADKYIEIDLAANTNSFEILAIDGGTASYVSDCKIGLSIDGISHMASNKADDSSRPNITGITVTNENSKVKVTMPTWRVEWGTSVASVNIKASSDSGGSWKFHRSNQWVSGGIAFKTVPTDVSWNSTVNNNQALVWAKIYLVSTNSPASDYWYYAEGK